MADAEKIIQWGVENGFEPSQISSGEFEGQRYLCFDLIKDIVPEIALIFADISRLLDVARSLNALYDGWGCMLVKSD